MSSILFLSDRLVSTKCHGTHAHNLVDLICGSHKLRRLMCLSIHLLSDRLVLPNATANLHTFLSIRFVFPQDETADVFSISIVGQVGVPPNATAEI